ncbi:hypothetical protein N7461_000857 [Penicillium sp. DV-2018c]|nr:hypothetical protein N7461_000857 [Penicillium sp. DV-2018c]
MFGWENSLYLAYNSLYPGREVAIHAASDPVPGSFSLAMTINKSQGQSLDMLVDLRVSPYTHEQLYVAFSRTTAADQVVRRGRSESRGQQRRLHVEERL